MKNKISKIILIFVLAFTINIVNVETIDAQCPMCKMSAESNLKDGGTEGKGLNKGILYLFAAPYLMMGGLALIWYRSNRKKREEDEDDAIRDLLNGVG